MSHSTHFTPRIHRVVHNLQPAFEGGNLEEGQVGHAHVVKVDRGVDPHGVVLDEARVHVRGDLMAHSQQATLVNALQVWVCGLDFRALFARDTFYPAAYISKLPWGMAVTNKCLK